MHICIQVHIYSGFIAGKYFLKWIHSEKDNDFSELGLQRDQWSNEEVGADVYQIDAAPEKIGTTHVYHSANSNLVGVESISVLVILKFEIKEMDSTFVNTCWYSRQEFTAS